MASRIAQRVKNPPAMQETQETRVLSLGQEDPLEKEVATHCSVLAWEIPRTEEPGESQSLVSPGGGHNLVTKQQATANNNRTTHYFRNQHMTE